MYSTMAIWVDQLKANDVNSQSKEIGMVWDMSFLNDLKLKGNHTKDEFAAEINKWAEKQVDDIQEVQLLKEMISKWANVDSYFDKEIVEDAKKDMDGLKSTLVEFVETTSDFQNESQALASAINFQITPEGNNKIMNGKAANDYYNKSGTVAWAPNYTQNNAVPTVPSAISTLSNAPVSSQYPQPNPTLWNTTGKFGQVGDAGKNYDIPTSSLSAVQERKDRVKDELTGYEYQNIYMTKWDKKADRLKDGTNHDQKAILRKLYKGKEISDIIELDGDNKINKPEKAERDMLYDHFATPLKRLTINNLLDYNINPFVVLTMLDETYNAPATHAKIGWLWKEAMNEKYWTENMLTDSALSASVQSNSAKRNFAENMAKLTALYVSYREWAFKWKYTERLLDMFNEEVKKNGSEFMSSERTGNWSDILDNNDKNTGSVDLWEWYEILTKESKKSKALSGLKNLGLSIDDTTEKLINIPSWSLRALFNDAKKWENVWLKYAGFTGGKELYQTVRDNGDVSPLVEWVAFGATPVDIYNIKAVAQLAQVDTSKWRNITDSGKFMNFLSDYDHNGRWWGPADHNVNSGGQLLANFRLAATQMKYEGNMSQEQAEAQAVSNILRWTRNNAAMTDLYVKQVLEQYMNWASPMDIVKQHPGLVVYIQDKLKSFQGDIQSIMMSWFVWSNSEYVKSQEKTIAATKLDTVEVALASVPESERAQVKTAIEQKANNEFVKIQKEIQSLSPQQQQYFEWVNQQLLAQHMANTVAASMNVNQYGVGAGIALKIVDGLQANLSVASGPDMIPVPGIGIGMHSANGRFGVNANMTVFGPNLSATRRVAQRKWDARALANTLQARAQNTNSINLHGWIGVDGWSAGLWYQQDKDFMAGIEKTYSNLKKEICSFLPWMMNQLAPNLKNLKEMVQHENFAQNPSYDTNRNSIIAILQSALIKKYPWQSTDDYARAANDLFVGMVYMDYDGSSESNTMLTNYFAEQWKEQSVDNLKNKMKLTGWGVWLHAFITPTGIPLVAPFTFKLSRYNRWYAHIDSAASLYKLDVAQNAGIGNREVQFDLTKRINYINDMILNVRWFAKDWDPIAEKQKIAVVDDGKFIKIPQQLYRWNKINIKVSPTMKWKIASENWDLYVPVDAPLRFSAGLMSQWADYVLNIGSTITSSNDLHLVRARDGLITQVDNGWLFVADRSQINISSQSGVLQWYDTTKLQATIKDPTIQIISADAKQITYTESWVQKTQPLQGGKIGKYTLSQNGNSLVITWSDETWTPTQEQCDPLVYADTLWDNIKKSIIDNNVALEQFETSKNFYPFLEKAIDGNTDEEALKLLSGLKVPWLSEYISKATPQQKSELVSLLTQSFALEDAKYKNKTAIQLMDERDSTVKWGKKSIESGKILPAYARIEWSNDIEKLFNRWDLKNIYKDINTKPGLSNPIRNDIIWYTAFYQRKANKDARWYAMTVPWYTRILWDKINDFDTTKQADARKWLIDKLTTDNLAKAAVLSSLQKKYPEVTSVLTEPQIVALLADPNHVEKLSNGCTIQLKTTPIFYLLGECANESIGLKIDACTCKGPSGESMTIDGNLTQEYTAGRFAVNVSSSKSSAYLGKKDVVNFGIAGGVKVNGNNGGEEWKAWGTHTWNSNGNSWNTWSGNWNWNWEDTGP